MSIWNGTKLHHSAQMMPSTAVALDNRGCPSLDKGCEILSAEGELGGHLMLGKRNMGMYV